MSSNPIQTPPAPDIVLRFGVFEADLRSAELRKNGVKVKVQELPFRALRLLLSHPDQVLSREEFRKAMWPENVFVDFDHGISSAINRLRDALGDSADNPLFIETVDRRGYRWIAPTRIPPQPAAVASPLPFAITPVIKPAPSPVAPQPTGNGFRRTLNFALPVLILLGAILVARPIRRLVTASPSHPKSTNSAAPRAANPEAEDFYLKGRYYWNKRTPADLNKAIDYFTQAIVHDPNYAAAYVGLADTYNLMREYTLMPSSEAYPRALAAAQKAVELDGRSSEAHASLAFASYYWKWDVATAEKEFRRSIQLDPNNAIAHHWFATYLMTRSRFPEAIAEIERARALDPASASILADKGCILFTAGRHEEAIALLKQMEAMEPKFVSPHRYLKSAYFSSGDYRDYISELRQESALLHDPSAMALAATAEKGFSAGGRQKMLESMFVQEKKSYEQGLSSPYRVAEIAALLQRQPEAIQYLKLAFDRHDESVMEIENDQAFASLRTDPAFRELAARLETPNQH
jgi:DNA-binding winged helix-turn-helix (wHTH) protein/tetratricopeptide (TPR) repeat protein